ncbi:MAG TPA: hypothetical protein ENK11_08435, partial [Phycisphaerales bacterium]|nr:hypothetical protein [Phycisphaerales bacterium]
MSSPPGGQRDPDFPGAATRPGASTRSITLALSAAVTIAIAAVFFFLSSNHTEINEDDHSAAIEAQDIMQILGEQGESGEGMVIQRMDKDDPTRLVAEIAVDRLDPDGPLHRNADAPRAWLFADDGTSWYIEADEGRFYIPAGEDTPESGVLKGHVRVRRYAASDDRPAPETTPPLLTATTDEPLHFDLDVLMFETEGRLHVHTDRLDFTGRGVYVVLNEKREKITYLRVDQGERLAYTPASASTSPMDRQPSPEIPAGPAQPEQPESIGRASPTSPTAAAVVPVAWQPAVQPSPAEPTGPKIDLYRVEFKGNVQAARGRQVIRSDTLTVWARLIDNKIPPDDTPAPLSVRGPLPVLLSFAPFASTPAVDTATEAPTPGTPVTPDSQVLPDETATDGDTQPVVLTWDGPMEVNPLDGAPEPLTMGDNIALRFDVTEGHVEFEDTQSNARGRAQSVAYFAGRERVELLGPAGSIRLESPDTGTISGVNSMYIELAAGVVTVPTAGELTSRPDRPEPERKHIKWSSSALFQFALDDAGRMTDRIERARFEGDVAGTDRDASLRGDHLDAMFDTPEGRSPRLIQIDVDNARGTDGKGGSLAGEHMRVHFDTRSAVLVPRRVILDGSASASR